MLLSFKQYRELMNESFVGGAMTLGIRTPGAVGGVVGAHPELTQEEDVVDEGKKKKMDGDMDMKDVEDHDEPDGDEECGCDDDGGGDDKGEMTPMMMMKKKAAKKMKKESAETCDEACDCDDEDKGKDIDPDMDSKGDNVDKGRDENVPANLGKDNANTGFMKKKSSKKMAKEEVEMTDDEKAWWNSVNSMMGDENVMNPKFWSGITMPE